VGPAYVPMMTISCPKVVVTPSHLIFCQMWGFPRTDFT
jgi:hypothetical protein